jgi:phage major head subunit gpT-like protein
MSTFVTQARVSALQVTFRKDYDGAYGDTPTWWPQFATQVPSGSASTTQGWLARSLRVRKWSGPRLIRSLYTHSQEIPNEDFELTVGVPRNDIEDDILAVHSRGMADFGRANAKWPDDLLFERLAENPVCFDGQPFFDTDHPLDPAGVQSNDFNLPLTDDNFDTVWQAMASYTGEDSKPLGVMPDRLVVPPQLKKAGREIVEADRNAAGATNVQKGDAKLVVIPELALFPTQWHLIDSSKGIMPWFWQLRRAMRLILKSKPGDNNVFWDKEIIWGSDGRGQVAPGPWWLHGRSTPP